MHTSPDADTAPMRRSWRRFLGGAAVVAVGFAGLGACGTDTSEDTRAALADTTFCDAVAVYADKIEDGDKTMMANALEGSTEDLSDADERIVDAYIAALTAVSSNHPPEDRGVEDEAEAGFRRVARHHCGADALPASESSGSDTSTTDPIQTTTTDGGEGSETDGDMG